MSETNETEICELSTMEIDAVSGSGFWSDLADWLIPPKPNTNPYVCVCVKG